MPPPDFCGVEALNFSYHRKRQQTLRVKSLQGLQDYVHGDNDISPVNYPVVQFFFLPLLMAVREIWLMVTITVWLLSQRLENQVYSSLSLLTFILDRNSICFTTGPKCRYASWFDFPCVSDEIKWVVYWCNGSSNLWKNDCSHLRNRISKRGDILMLTFFFIFPKRINLKRPKTLTVLFQPVFLILTLNHCFMSLLSNLWCIVLVETWNLYERWAVF